MSPNFPSVLLTVPPHSGVPCRHKDLSSSSRRTALTLSHIMTTRAEVPRQTSASLYLSHGVLYYDDGIIDFAESPSAGDLDSDRIPLRRASDGTKAYEPLGVVETVLVAPGQVKDIPNDRYLIDLQLHRTQITPNGFSISEPQQTITYGTVLCVSSPPREIPWPLDEIWNKATREAGKWLNSHFANHARLLSGNLPSGQQVQSIADGIFRSSVIAEWYRAGLTDLDSGALSIQMVSKEELARSYSDPASVCRLTPAVPAVPNDGGEFVRVLSSTDDPGSQGPLVLLNPVLKSSRGGIASFSVNTVFARPFGWQDQITRVASSDWLLMNKHSRIHQAYKTRIADWEQKANLHANSLPQEQRLQGFIRAYDTGHESILTLFTPASPPGTSPLRAHWVTEHQMRTTLNTGLFVLQHSATSQHPMSN